jgi:hypothetical protein
MLAEQFFSVSPVFLLCGLCFRCVSAVTCVSCVSSVAVSRFRGGLRVIGSGGAMTNDRGKLVAVLLSAIALFAR